MRHRLPDILHTAFFALALIFAGVFSAFAEGATALGHHGVTTMVICGDETRTVTIDRSGKPVEPSRSSVCSLCPDCILHAAAMPAASDLWVRPIRFAHGITPRIFAIRNVDVTARWHPARGPPNKT